MPFPVLIRRRAFLAGVAGAAAGLGLDGSRRAVASVPDAITREDLGQLLICGFAGKDPTSPSAQWLARQIRQGHVAGAVFVKENIGSRDEVVALTALFSGAAPQKPILAIDHEGGAVQRLVERHGCDRLPSAKTVAATWTVQKARDAYERAGRGMARLGFNLNLAPDVDLDEPRNPAIGHFGRSFSADPQVVVAYAGAFVDGFRKAGVACVLKHFPGQGNALEDSHLVLSGRGSGWSQKDVMPFRGLIAERRAPVVMTGLSAPGAGHEPGQAAALSRAIVTDLLRDGLGFDGVALTDDLDMGATGGGHARGRVVRQALQAGNDLLMIRNVLNHDPDLPDKVATWVAEGLSEGTVSSADLSRSAARVRAFRVQELG